MKRVSVSGDTFQMNGQEVVLMGGNYVLKSYPFFPPVDVVKTDAQILSQGAKNMSYVPPPAADGTARPVVPCVRLGTMMDAAMPEKGKGIDPSFITKLEATIEAFRDEGVYVFCDIHTDSVSATGGGDGMPWWAISDFQDRAGCFMEQCCCCCCFSGSCWSGCPECCRTSYLTNSQHPLQPCFCLPNCLLNCFGFGITTYEGDKEPWKAYSVGGEGNPSYMNVGNPSMRMNNSDEKWHTLYISAQAQNSAKRLYGSARNKADKESFFDPYVSFVKYLCSLWEKYENVIAVELLNEPPLGGLPNLCYALSIWRRVDSFFGDVLEELAKEPIQCPIAITNFGSAAPSSECLFSCLSLAGIPSHTKKQYQLLKQQNRLIFSFHYYTPPLTNSLQATIDAAKKFVDETVGGAPIWLSEFFENTPEKTANSMGMAIDAGVPAACYWNYANTDYTGQDGWFKYPPDVLGAGSGIPVNGAGVIDPLAWEEYAKTVANNSHFGADITGSGGAHERVLELVPAKHEGRADARRPWPQGRWTRFHRAPRTVERKSKTPKALTPEALTPKSSV